MINPETTYEDVDALLRNLKPEYRLSSIKLVPQDDGEYVVIAEVDPVPDVAPAPAPDMTQSIRANLLNSMAARRAIIARTDPHVLKKAAKRPDNAPKEGSYVISLTSAGGPARESASGARLAGATDIGTRSQAFKIIDYKERTEGGQTVLYAHWAILSLNLGQDQIVEGRIVEGARVDNLAGGAYEIDRTEAQVIEALMTFNYLDTGGRSLLREYQGSEAIRTNFYGTKYKRYGRALFEIQHEQAIRHFTYDATNPLKEYAWLCPGSDPDADRTRPGADAHVVYAPYDKEPTTIDHIESVAEHWNNTGRKVSQDERERWDDDITKLQLMDRAHNSALGSGGVVFDHQVEPTWRGPGNLR